MIEKIFFQCYFRAMSVGDLEGMAVIKLARYYNLQIAFMCNEY